MKSPSILLIIPAHNEAKSIKKTLSIVNASPYDYIVINDGSTDQTATILADLHAPHLNLSFNLGIGGAVQTGYKYALENGYDIAVQFDADGQHDIASVATLIEPLCNNRADFVIGSRFIQKSNKTFKSSFLRRLGIRLISNIIFIFSRQHIYDATSGFRAANQKVIEAFADDYPLEYPEPVSDFELLKNNYRISEVSVKMKKREQGRSSIRSWKSAYYVVNVLLSILMIELRRKKHE